MRIIDCTEKLQWQKVLDQCISYDFYHLPAYSMLEAQRANYSAKLFVYEEGDAIVALPLIIRPLDESPQSGQEKYYDATSVYGYCGPVTNQQWTNYAFFERFGNALQSHLYELRVISVFSRLHPILGNDAGLCVGEVLALGETVSIDLTLSVEEQFGFYRKSHRYEIRKARAKNIAVIHDARLNYFDDFINLYIETMQRVNADKHYYFDRAYFDQLQSILGKNLHLFAAIHDKKVISAALFTVFNGLVEYHLSGSSTDELNYAASKLVIDEVRLWANKNSAITLHLGGGLGSREDELFLFKSGFSRVRQTFKIWRFIVDHDRYDLEVQKRRKWLSAQGWRFVDENYFPLYRSSFKGSETSVST